MLISYFFYNIVFLYILNIQLEVSSFIHFFKIIKVKSFLDFYIRCQNKLNYIKDLRESIPKQVDKKSRGPQRERSLRSSGGGDRNLEVSRRRKVQTFFFFLYIS